MMMMFIGTETSLTQLENERSRVHATEVPATGHVRQLKVARRGTLAYSSVRKKTADAIGQGTLLARVPHKLLVRCLSAFIPIISIQ